MTYVTVGEAATELKMDSLEIMVFLREKEGDERFRIRFKNAGNGEENCRMCDHFLHEARHPGDLFDQFELPRCSVMAYKETTSLEGRKPAVGFPRSGSKKDKPRIKATHEACEKVREEMKQERHVFDNDNSRWEPVLLLDTGKTKGEIFKEAVKKIAGKNYQETTAREEWKKVPQSLKHTGGIPHQ